MKLVVDSRRVQLHADRAGQSRTMVARKPVDDWMLLVSVSSMYGLPVTRPSIRSLGSVIRYCSFSPVGSSSSSVAWPFWRTMIEGNENDVFWPEAPTSESFLAAFEMWYAVIGGWCETCSTKRSVWPRLLRSGQ